MPCLTRSVYQTNKLLPFPDLFVQPTMKNVIVKSHNIGKHIRILFETMLTAQDNNYQIGGSKAFFWNKWNNTDNCLLIRIIQCETPLSHEM